MSRPELEDCGCSRCQCIRAMQSAALEALNQGAQLDGMVGLVVERPDCIEVTVEPWTQLCDERPIAAALLEACRHRTEIGWLQYLALFDTGAVIGTCRVIAPATAQA